VLLFCVFGFITILFVMRFKDIAEFASLHSSMKAVFLFSLFQIPYILPYAIPISCLIASILLFQRLSTHGELTTLRASGFPLKVILFPVLISGAIMSVVNFTIVSELVPYTKYLAKELAYQMTSSNPFYIFNKITEGKLSSAYVDMRSLKTGKQAKDVLLIMNNRGSGRLALVLAKDLTIDGEDLLGKDVYCISSIDSKDKESFDHLVIENQATMATKASSLSTLMQNTDWHMGLEYLPLRLIRAKAATKPGSIIFDTLGVEIGRRISIALAPFVFTLMGSVLGMSIGRRQTRRGLILACLLSAFYLACFVGAKSLKHAYLTSWLIYFIPFPIIIFLTYAHYKKINRGVE
jgi:lipopolysaccharide export system permease protein